MRFSAIVAALATAATAAHALTIGDLVGVERRADGKTCLSRRAGGSATVTSLEQCKGVCNSWFPANKARAVRRQNVTDLTSCLALCNSYFPATASSAAKPASSAAASSSKAPAASASVSKAAVASSSSKPPVASSSKAPVVSSSKASVASSSKAPVASSSSKAPVASSSKASAPASSSKAAAASSAAAPAATDATAKAFVDAHNTARAAYGAGPVTWNADLATFAATTAAKCQMVHSGGPYGENLAAGTGSYSVQNAMNGWMGEAPQYNYNSPGFSSGTGHFTQVVWKATTEIGCAIKTCADGTIFTGYGTSNLIVCEYRVPGNLQGAFPANVGKKA